MYRAFWLDGNLNTWVIERMIGCLPLHLSSSRMTCVWSSALSASRSSWISCCSTKSFSSWTRRKLKTSTVSLRLVCKWRTTITTTLQTFLTWWIVTSDRSSLYVPCQSWHAVCSPPFRQVWVQRSFSVCWASIFPASDIQSASWRTPVLLSGACTVERWCHALSLWCTLPQQPVIKIIQC